MSDEFRYPQELLLRIKNRVSTVLPTVLSFKFNNLLDIKPPTIVKGSTHQAETQGLCHGPDAGIISSVIADMHSIFDDLAYTGPLRERPRRYYEASSEAPASVGSRGENAPNILHRQFDSLDKRIGKWVREFEFGDAIRLEDLSDDVFALQFITRRPRSHTNIADAGFGASQVLPLVVQAVASTRDSLTIAEQPEIHLNPRLQTLLADLFVDMANRRRNVIVETHSEHFLLRLRRLVATGRIKNDRIALYYVEKRGGISQVRAVPIKPNGHIDTPDWPRGFFEEALRESLALASVQSPTY